MPTPENNTERAIVVRDMAGNEVKRIPVSNPTIRKVDRIVSGLLINMDVDNYYVDDSEFDDLPEPEAP